MPGAGFEPARTQCPRDFKSLVSTDFTTRAWNSQKSSAKTTRQLQRISSGANEVERETGIEPATPTMARSCSTTELLPHYQSKGWDYISKNLKIKIKNKRSKTIGAIARIAPRQAFGRSFGHKV